MDLQILELFHNLCRYNSASTFLFFSNDGNRGIWNDDEKDVFKRLTVKWKTPVFLQNLKFSELTQENQSPTG